MYVTSLVDDPLLQKLMRMAYHRRPGFHRLPWSSCHSTWPNNFTNILRAAFAQIFFHLKKIPDLRRTRLYPKIQTQAASTQNVRTTHLYEKAARKMLMKLTPDQTMSLHSNRQLGKGWLPTFGRKTFGWAWPFAAIDRSTGNHQLIVIGTGRHYNYQ